jgi:two-component system CheB/CheR fusion protein
VLIVDDNDDSLEVLREVLERAGALVTMASSGQEALDAIDKGTTFALIISDIGMPEIDGYAFLRRVRANDLMAKVPAIALTAYARASDAESARRAGFQEHLAKPVDEHLLLRAVETWSRTSVETAGS